MSEQSRIEALTRVFGVRARELSPGLEVGIGDDAAVLDVAALRAGAKLVVSNDEQIEGTHFRREWLALEDIGYRATMAAASDLAAMGADPIGIVAALALPADMTDADVEAIARGQRAAADLIGCAVVGGNLASAPFLSIATTVLGTASRPLTRSGARLGDDVWVAGALGLAALGLEAFLRKMFGPPAQLARDAWARPRARMMDGRAAAAVAHAAIDVSDGLAKDLLAVCKSSGVAAEIDVAALRELAKRDGTHEVAQALGANLLTAMTTGGEDYALLVTAAAPMPGFHRIGRIVGGAPAAELVFEDGHREPMRGGFDHFDARNDSV